MGMCMKEISAKTRCTERAFLNMPLEICPNLSESGKKERSVAFFEDIVRVSKKVYYDNGEIKSDPNENVKREAPSDEDTDSDEGRPSKRRNVCVSPP
mmetsp:Transcript_2652/g.4014  ORF Transcript_2652/g.4014 Transcript_2652/m.4014 type:complete len:97 (+) Transcript_2652:30-320(+)